MKAYQYERVFVRLEKEQSAGGSESPSAEPRSHPGREPQPSLSPSPQPVSATSVARKVVKWTSLGFAGAALGTGIVASIIHTNSVNEFTMANGGDCRDDDGVARDTNGKVIAECQDSLNSHRNARTWQIVGFVGAGAFLATWLILQLTESNGSAVTQTTSLSCAPVPLASGAIGSCALRF